MNEESKKINILFEQLLEQPKYVFPQQGQKINASIDPGVYVIRREEDILHVGRTLKGKNGLRQRLKNHLYGNSSFVRNYLSGNGDILRSDGYTYQYLILKDARERALLEALATGKLCPKYIGLGKNKKV